MLRSPPTPLLGRLVFAAAFAAAVWRAWPELTALQVGIAGALAAFFIAANGRDVAGVYAAFMSAAGVILIVSLLAESHRLAFRDTLTGLPGRRALEERLRSLGGRYAVAMVDVDHFKKFNDTHGHDIGDQVLKLVGGAPRRGRRRRHRLPLRRRGVQRAVPRLDAWTRRCRTSRRSAPRSRATAWRCARPTGRNRARRAPSCAATEQCAEKHLSVTVSIGACGPKKKRAHAGAGDQGGRRGAVPRQAGRPEPGQYLKMGSDPILIREICGTDPICLICLFFNRE